VNLLGLLCWYDEPIENLGSSILGMSRAGVDHMICVDGAYALYPDAKPTSHVSQYGEIQLACRALGMRCTIHSPAGPWQGNEVEKRTFHFRLANALAEPGDWFFVMDADQVVIDAPSDLKDRLADTDLDAAETSFIDTVALRTNDPSWPARFEIRNLFRAQDIRCSTNHCTYVTSDGRLLWGWEWAVDNGGERPLEPCLDVTDLVIEHHPDQRPAERQRAKLAYYSLRDELRVERGACGLCGAQSVQLMPTRWRWSELGPVADWVEACEPCGQQVAAVNRVELERMGVDPNGIKVENRNGHVPPAMPTRMAA
jgi:hypothetical protein